MKKTSTLATLTSLLLSSTAASAQWTPLAEPTSPDYTGEEAGKYSACDDLHFVDASNGFLVFNGVDAKKQTSYPMFLKTSDGSTFTGGKIAGVNFGVPLSVTERMRVRFATPQVGFLTLNDRVAKTSDGGATWTRVLAPVDHGPIQTIYPVSADLVIAAGSNLVRTTNGAATATAADWTQLDPENNQGPFGEIMFFDASVGLVIEGGVKILRTSNAGESWAETAANPGIYIQRWARGSATVAYGLGKTTPNGQVGSDKITKTVDGGQTWSAAAVLPCAATSIAFTDENNGIIGCRAKTETGIAIFKDTHFMLRTSDGGGTWTEEAWPVGWAPSDPSGQGYVGCLAAPPGGAAYAGYSDTERRLIKGTGGGTAPPTPTPDGGTSGENGENGGNGGNSSSGGTASAAAATDDGGCSASGRSPFSLSLAALAALGLAFARRRRSA